MPVYNRAHHLPETINSILRQTFADFELLIFDDGSTDGSPEIVRSFSDERIVFLGSHRCGPPHPLNELYARARGEFVIILHDHDIFDPALLQKSVDVLSRHPSAGFVLPGCATVAEDGASNYREMLHMWPTLNSGWEAGSRLLRQSRSFSSPFHACSMVRASALDSVGRFYDVRYGLHADVDLWLRLLRRFEFCYINEVLFRFRERERAGHFLHGREAEVANVLRRIFIKHGLEFFADDPQGLDEVLRSAQKAYIHLQRRAAVRNLVRNARHLRIAARSSQHWVGKTLGGMLVWRKATSRR